LAERSYFFSFAPTQIAKRLAEWRPEEYERRTSDFMKSAAAKTAVWMTSHKIKGLAELLEIHPDVCNGKIPANEALVVEL